MELPTSGKQERIEILTMMHLLDGAADPELDDFLALAREMSGCAVAFVCCGFQDWQQIVSSSGLFPHEKRFANLSGSKFLATDADPDRFLPLPLSADETGGLGEVSLAGIKLHAGYQTLGCLCVFDRFRRDFTEKQLNSLNLLARQLKALLEARWQVAIQTKLNRRLTDALERASGSQGDAMLAASRLEALFHGLPTACFTYDLDSVVMEWNTAAEKLFGIPAHEVAGHCMYDVLSSGRVGKRAKKLVSSILAGGSVSDIEWTYRRKDGQRVRISTSAFPMYGRHHQIVGAMSAHVDLTALREHEVALRTSEHQMRAVISTMRDGLVFQNADGRIMISNPSAERILGLSKAQIEKRAPIDPLWRVIKPDGTDLDESEHPAQLVLKSGDEVHDFLMGISRSDGSLVWIEMDAAPIFNEHTKKVSAVVCTFSDVSRRVEDERVIQKQLVSISDYSLRLDMQQIDLEDANRRLEALATTDGLTGLLNHRCFQDCLEREFRLASRTRTQLSLILLDIDSFKSLNDRFGHQAGDEVLGGVAFALKDGVRLTDIVARYGGEEMVVILPDTDYGGALLVAEKLRASFEDSDWGYCPVTASFGVSTLTKKVLDRQTLIEQADQALYYSKANGKNKVTHFWDLPGQQIELSGPRTECA